MISAVIDPSVLVSAFIGNAAAGPGQVLTAWKAKRFSLVVSPLVLAELGDVLSRVKFEQWTSGGLGDDYIALLATEGESQPDPGIAPNVVRDPKDDYLVALALAVKADALVSVDKDLLGLEIEGLTICRPVAFLEQLGQS